MTTTTSTRTLSSTLLLLAAQEKLLGDAMALGPTGRREPPPSIQIAFSPSSREGENHVANVPRTKEEMYQEHERTRDERGVPVDGCFYCGGDHPSSCCTSDERYYYWDG